MRTLLVGMLFSCSALCAQVPSASVARPSGRSTPAAITQTPVEVKLSGPVQIERSERERQLDTQAAVSKEDTDHALVLWTAGLVAVTGILAVITGLLAWFTFKLWQDAVKNSLRQSEEVKQSLAIAKESADAARNSADMFKADYFASNRPWVWITAGVKDWERDLDGFLSSIEIRFDIHNTGNSPALDVWVEAKGIPHVGNRLMWDVQKEFCDNLRTHYLERAEVVPRIAVFPTYPEEQVLWVPFDRQQIQAMLNEKGTTWSQPYIVGCATYRTSLDGEPHQTRFIFTLGQEDTDFFHWARRDVEIQLVRSSVGHRAD